MTVSQHISDDCLERYYLGMIHDEQELAPLEEHLLCCESCVDRAVQTQCFIDWQRALIIEAGLDV